jgi:hypothetical protein
MKRNLLKKRCFENFLPAIVEVLGHSNPTFDREKEARELRAELAIDGIRITGSQTDCPAKLDMTHYEDEEMTPNG